MGLAEDLDRWELSERALEEARRTSESPEFIANAMRLRRGMLAILLRNIVTEVQRGELQTSKMNARNWEVIVAETKPLQELLAEVLQRLHQIEQAQAHITETSFDAPG